MDAICNPVRSRRRFKTHLLALAAFATVGMSGSVLAQALEFASMEPESVAAAPGDRLCTAGFNPDYGWFEVASIGLGVLEIPGLTQGNCSKATPAGLAVQMGGLTLPLAEQAVYTLVSAPPTLNLSLLEPVLCEDYYAAGGGSSNWKLSVKDANDETMRFNVGLGSETMPGVNSLSYVLTSGALVPQRTDTGVQWLRCHAGLAPNAVSPTTGPGTANHVFADGMEPSMADLRVELIDVQSGNPVAGDVLQQSTTGNVQFKVRVSNKGTADAQNVRIREFVPTASALMGPTVSRSSCFDHGAGSACNSGVGSLKLVENIGTLLKGTQREYTLTRKSSSVDTSATQSMALIQVAAFSDPNASPDSNYADNSRSLRIEVVNQVQVTRAVSTNNNPSDASGGLIIRVSAPTGCSAEAGTVTTCPPGTHGLEYSATAISGYTFTGFTGCVGNTTGGTTTGGTFTTTMASTCTLTANFRTMPTVTASVSGGNGTVSPASQAAHYNQPAPLTITPNVGYTVDTNATTGCGGITQVGGTSWQTAPVTGNCAVSVKFKVAQYTVTATSTGNGTVSPESVPVQHGQPASFIVSPAANHHVSNVSSTCASFPGIWINGTEYLLTNITSDCSVAFEFELITHSVVVSPTIQNGTIKFLDASNNELPGTTVAIPHGQKVRFKPVADSGYGFSGSPSAVSATNCSLNSLAWDFGIQAYVGETNPIVADNCTLSATFMPE